MRTTMRWFSAMILSFFLYFATQAQTEKLPVLVIDPGRALSAMGVDTTNTERIRALLDSSETFISKYASLYLAKRGFADMVPGITSRYRHALANQSTNLTDLADYLVSLYLLGAPETGQLCNTYLDTLVVRYQRGSPFAQDLAGQIISVLLNLGDYSRFDLLDTVIQSCVSRSYPLNLDLVLAFGEKPELRSGVFQQIKNLAGSPITSLRSDAVFLLSHFGDVPETQQILRNLAASDSSLELRLEAIRVLVSCYDDPFVIAHASQIAKTTADTSTFVQAVLQVSSFPSPLAFAHLKDLQNFALPPFFLSFVSNAVRSYRPPSPSFETPLTDLIDSLDSYLSQVSVLGWLSDDTFVAELHGCLQSSQAALFSSDSVGCARNIQSFQGKLELVYRDSLNPDSRRLTIEGWKFLYYNAQYILDRLPQIPPSAILVSLTPTSAFAGSPGLSLNVKGTSFVSSSVVVWNGSYRPTTFIADSLLQATIQTTDLATARTSSVVVVNPGNDTSNVLLFTIKLPPPMVTTLAPAMAEVGSGAFTLAVSGSHFGSSAVVTWRGLARTTTFVSESKLRASIPATDVAAVDSPLVGVKNADGSQSNTLKFMIIKTVSMFLDDLRSQLSQLLTKGLIGDANFVKELDNGLENAKKHLAKKDSVNCYKEIQKFQDKVNKEYEKTVDNEKKGKSRDKRFVTVEGWKFLYYNAQYIMDRLPGGKR